MRPQLHPKKTTVRRISNIYSSKRHYNHGTLLYIQSTLVLKVGVLYRWQNFRRRLVHGVAVAIAA